MKYISKIAFAIILTIFACSKEQQDDQVSLIDNSENINKLINSFDIVLKEYISNPNLSEDSLGNLFIEESRKNGLRIIEIEQNSDLDKSNDNNTVLSNEYVRYSNTIKKANTFATKEEYKNSLHNLYNDVIGSNISIEEKQSLVDNIGFMLAFVDWMGTLENSVSKANLVSKAENECDGWWSCWGKCVAGTLGGVLTGALGGCGVGAGVGAAAGAAIAAVPSLGIATAAGAGVGAVVGCAAGGIVGAIGGGLTGAAASCG